MWPSAPRILATVLSASLYGAAFATSSSVGAALGWLALVPLFVATARASSSIEATLLATLWTAIATTAVAGWLPSMISGFFHVSLATAVALFVLVVIVAVAPYYVTFALWLRWRSNRAPLAPLSVGLAWAALEFARANLWIADPWALLAYSQAPWTWTIQIADIGGPYLLGAIMAAVGASLASPFVPALRAAGLPMRVAPPVLAAAMLVYGVVRSDHFDSSKSEHRVAVVQGAIPLDERFDPRQQPRIEQHYLALTRRAIEAGARLVAWPEFALLRPLLRSPDTNRRLSELSLTSGADLLVGSSTLDPDDSIRNSYFLVRGGRLEGRYDKVGLMPFSETNPVPWLVERDAGYVMGTEPVLLDTSLGRAGIVICSEAMHPSYVRETVRLGAEYLVNPSVDDWFRNESAARQQLDALRFRAIEQRRDVLRPTSGGFTTVIDASGAVAPPLALGEPGFVVAPIQTRDDVTVYSVVGDFFTWSAGLFIAADAMRRRSRSISRENGGAI